MAYRGRIDLAMANIHGTDKLRRFRFICFVGAVLAGLILLLTPVPAHAQSCALCYTQAATSGSRMIQALKSGILILIAPPTFMTIGLFFVCLRKRNQTREETGESEREWTRKDSF